MIKDFYWLKESGTYADSNAAFGLARLLYLLTDEHPWVYDEGPYYRISLRRAIDLDELPYDDLQRDPCFPFIRRARDKGAPSVAINYEAGRQRLLMWRKERDRLKKLRQTLSAEERNQLAALAPDPEWYLIQNLNVLQGLNAYNGLHTAIRNAPADDFRKAVAIKLRLCAERKPVTDVRTPFNPRVSAVQVFNPVIGKGINRTKPNGVSPSGLPSGFTDWFSEWVRFVGINQACNSLPIGDDIKLWGLAPEALRMSFLHAHLYGEFIKLPLPYSNVKLEIIALIGLAKLLVLFSEAQTGDKEGLPIGATPRDVIAGLHTAYFQKLGSSRVLANVSFLGLPGWFPVKNISDVEAWVSVLDEHRRIVGALSDEKSEEFALLSSYRDFLSSAAVNVFVEFLASYGAYYMRASERNRRLRRFTTTNMRGLLERMADQMYAEIVKAAGFRAIAAAIRRSTVSEQFRKSQGNQQYEIHYGLFQELRQKARFPDQTIALLSRFISDYNYENARKAEQRGLRSPESGANIALRRPQITTEQLDEVILLIDRFGSEPVAMLLAAYGSARESRETEDTTNQDENEEGTE